MGPPLSKRQDAAVRQMLKRHPDWIAVVKLTAQSLERKGLVEVRLTEQGWTECRLTEYGLETARTA